MPLGLVGDGKWNIARIRWIGMTKDSLNMRSVLVYIRDHDDHVTGAQGGIRIEGSQQLILKYLNLALRTVGNVEPNRLVLLWINR